METPERKELKMGEGITHKHWDRMWGKNNSLVDIRRGFWDTGERGKKGRDMSICSEK